MKKVIVIICLTAIMLFLLTGCNEGQSAPTSAYSSEFTVPDISIFAKSTVSYNYFYVVDNNTGVVYLQFIGYDKAGITAALNADGTPITIDQIKSKKVTK